MVTQTNQDEQIPAAGMDILEAIYTTRAMRRLKPDPVPADVLRAILDAAIRAPSGGNQQGWSFIAVQDAALRAGLAAIYKPCIDALFVPGSFYDKQLHSDDPAVAGPMAQVKKSALYLGNHLQDAPVIIVPCLETGGRQTDLSSGSSIYPAVQNLMLAARAFGVGSTLTTIHRMRQDEVRTLLGVPPTFETAALIPLGYPTGRWGVAKRKPLAEVVFSDHFGSAFA